MDRNAEDWLDAGCLPVALRKESVDRNMLSLSSLVAVGVALRKESVDRNFYYADKDCDWVRSLSARRAWIEISIDDLEPSKTRRSLSARRAWIEMAKSTPEEEKR